MSTYIAPAQWLDRLQRVPALQWGLPAILGAGVGLYVSIALLLKFKFALIVVTAVVIPCLAAMSGNMERFFALLALVLLPMQVNTTFGIVVPNHVGGAIAAFEFVLLELPLAAAIGLWAARSLSRQRRPGIAWGPIEWAFTAYFFWAASTIIIAPYKKFSIFELYRYFKFFMIYLYFANNIRTRKFLFQVVAVMFLGCFLQGIVTGVSYAFKIYLDGKFNVYTIRDIGQLGTGDYSAFGVKPPGEEHFAGFFRAGGMMGGFNVTAMYMAMWMPAMLAVYLWRREWWAKLGAAVAFASSGAALILTFSRGGWINTFIGCAVVLAVAWRKGKVTPWVRVQFLAVIVACATFAVSYGPIREKLIRRLTFEDTSVAVDPRIVMMKIAWMMISSNPVQGVGLNNYIDTVPGFYDSGEFGESLRKFPVHNRFMIVAAETGVPGFVLFTAFQFAILYTGFRNLRIRDPVLYPLALGTFACVPGWLFHMNVDIYDVYSILGSMFLVAGLVATLSRMAAGRYANATDSAPMGGPAVPRPLADGPGDAPLPPEEESGLSPTRRGAL
ncbi:MAG: O-antigen ligase family protein [Candidatus Methylomirabilis sp.]|nr:O-antigen ligase family protein [Deltaproteobacteria bacterium]